MLADALAAAAGPVTELISRTMYPYMELETFRESGKVGEWLTYYSQLAKATVQQLSGDTEEYFCISDDPDPAHGFVTPQLLRVLFVTYRTYSNSVAERHCYYATPEMTATVFAGSESIDNVSLTLADLPSRTGIAYLHQEDRDRDLILLWAADGEAVLHITLLSAEALAYLLAHEGRLNSPGHRWVNSRYLVSSTAEVLLSAEGSDEAPRLDVVQGAQFGSSGDPLDPDRKWGEDPQVMYPGRTSDEIFGLFASLMHMLPQNHVERSTIQARGRADSTGRRQPRAVTYLSYGRGRPKPQDPADDAAARRYSHRWVVRGHWKRQWYPSQNRHRPIWIDTYIAGPEGTPIEAKPKVTVLRGSRRESDHGGREDVRPDHYETQGSSATCQ